MAGRVFPEDPLELARTVRDWLARTAPMADRLVATPRAVIAPHAGLPVCGAVMAGAWSATRDAAPDRIVLLAAAPMPDFTGIAVPVHHGAIEIPGKKLRIDRDACRALIRSGRAHGREAAFEAQPGIDAHLPFARFLHPRVPVVPLVVGQVAPARIAAVIDRLDRLPGQTLFVLSSDLGRAGTAAEARRLQARTAALIETGQGARLTPDAASGALVLAGWQGSQAGQGCRALRLGHAVTHPKGGGPVSGHGAWAVYPPQGALLPDGLSEVLLDVARRAVGSGLSRGTAPHMRPDSYALPLRTLMASAVTLTAGGTCIGSAATLTPHLPLVADVAGNAARAALRDPRATGRAPDPQALGIEIDLLGPATPLEMPDEAALLARLVPGETGLALSDAGRHAMLLPSAWAELDDPQLFVAALRRKAGLPPDHWSATQQIRLLHAERLVAPAEALPVAA
ncbi:hypothetical protein AVJ23_20695 [Pseudoponticoccus marisrubri]|uniref:AMMECR1 domain-containing protein n=1 Tax=Pseudoponticoccus marisrubri TaxID=1685382 RepID=A0A0W7WE22_9RHOB|nr:hypothetical protein AVJ23_20695 [Pseudoponticoccus marisrubri]